EHTMFLIVEASEESRLREFMQPFQSAGSLDIYPASTCVRAVASGGCAAPMPAAADVPTQDPEEPCQQAIDAGMVVHRAHPLNCETSLAVLVGSVVMPNTRFYMRNNFRMPTLDGETFRLSIGGLVERSHSFTSRELQNMRSTTQVVTRECAGNGRALFDRPTEGEKWGLCAVSTAEWTGAGRGEHQRRRLAGSAPRERAQSQQLAVVGTADARGQGGAPGPPRPSDRSGRSHSARSRRVEPAGLRE
ncbi:MAG TPA: molybdopterin-dependent oxidoreductase, partial [Gemmatimonadaceae bacterium]|nr:molybdopterin-dependent oxidoreductase [Gemmatimonadaceae bacterium]